MKRFVHFFAALSVLLLTGCDKIGLGEGSNEVEANFSVALSQGTATKVDGVSEAASVDVLDVFVYDANGDWLDTVTPAVTKVDQTHYTVKVKLIRNVKYSFVFFAQKSGTYPYSADKKTITVDYSAGLCNDDTRDAFYALEKDYTVTGAFSKDITLRRPFAQVNFGSLNSDYTAAEASKVAFDATLTTAITVKKAASVLNLLDGTTGTPVDAVFTANKFQGGTLTVSTSITDTPVRYMAMAYILASSSKETATSVALDVVGKQSGIDFSIFHNVTNVPFQRNYRTNIVGDIFSVDGTFNVIIDPIYSTPDFESNL